MRIAFVIDLGEVNDEHSFNPDLEQRIAVKVQSGRYRSPDEVIQEGLDLLEARDASPANSDMSDTLPVWKIVTGIGQKISAEEWDRFPTDLARNMDHYLYGAEKISE